MCDFVQYFTESCSEEAAHTAVRTLIDFGVSDSFYGRAYLSVSLQNITAWAKTGSCSTPQKKPSDFLLVRFCVSMNEIQ